MSPRALALLQCIAGIGALTAMDAMVKWLSLIHSVPLVTFARYASGAALALLVWQAQRRPPITRAMLPAHLLRGSLIAVMALCFFFAISHLPLAEALTLTFIAPLLVPPMARLILGEAMQPRAALAGLIGFAGVLITVQGAPSFSGERLLATIAAVVAAVLYAATAIILRARAGRDGATVITLLAALVPAVLLSPIAIGAPPPSLPTLAAFAGLGLIGNIGVQLLARAYTHLEAQVSAVMEFTGLPWAALFGFFIFGEGVRPQVWAGAAVILAACLLASRPAKKLSPARPQSSP